MKTPRSLTAETASISFPKSDSLSGGKVLLSCGTPTMTNFVLSGLINTELIHHHLAISLKSSLRAGVPSLNSLDGSARNSFVSST